MIPYLVVFTVSTAFVAIAASATNRSKLIRAIFATAAVISVSALAGIRDFELGTDILVYGNRIFYSMLAAQTPADVLDYAMARDTPGELGYLFLNFAVARFSPDPHVFYFILSLLSSSLILTAIMLVRSLGSAVVMWLTYLLTAYVESYNLLRQSVALAFAVLGIALVLRSRYKTGLAIGALGLLFHNSAVIFIIMWGAATLVHSRRVRGRPAARAVIVATIAITLLVSPILDLLSPVVSGTTYENYLGSSSRSGQAFGVDALYRLVPICAGLILLRSRLTDSDQTSQRRTPTRIWRSSSNGLPAPKAGTSRASVAATRLRSAWNDAPDSLLIPGMVVLLTLLAIDLAMLPIREISYPFYRILAYFGYMRILAYGVMVNLVRGPRVTFAVGAVAFSAAYFLFIVVIRNEAFYRSEILANWIFMISGR